MKQVLVSVFGTSYRTAITGYATAIFTACLPYLQKGTFNIRTDWPYIAGAVGAAIFGHVSKDAAVSGKPDGTYNVVPTVSQDLIGAQLALKTAQNETNPNQAVVKALQAAVDE